jgi:DNA-binding transcriptional MerR regulator
MFKIGDFARLGQVSSRMLRYYDQLGLLVPRHTDKWSGYRYYTIDQLGQLNRIIALKELGLTLEQIGDLVADSNRISAERLRGMLTLKRAEIARTLQEEQRRLGRVEARLRQIEMEDQSLSLAVASHSWSICRLPTHQSHWSSDDEQEQQTGRSWHRAPGSVGDGCPGGEGLRTCPSGQP